jgi:hypothetical protein
VMEIEGDNGHEAEWNGIKRQLPSSSRNCSLRS